MKKVNKIDLIVVLFSVSVLILFVGYQRPLAIGPINNFETYENNVLFSIDKADYILIDSSIEFLSPKRYDVRDDVVISLEPGRYYWKVVGIGTSEVRELTIKSLVDLRLEKDEESYRVVNAGNVKLNVEVFNRGIFVESKKVGIGEKSYMEGDKFIGGQE